MLYLERWGKNRCKPLVMLAQRIAVSADLCYHLLKFARERQYDELTANVDDKERLSELYSAPDLAFWIAGAALHSKNFNVNDLEKARLDAPDMNKLIAVELGKITEEFNTRLANGLANIGKEKPSPPDDTLYKEHLKWLNSFITDNEEMPTNAEALLRIPEVIYFLRVLIPCWLEYGQTATELLELAKSGDLSAMKKLLRLDERFMEVPAFREAFYGCKKSLQTRGQEALALSLTEEPGKNLTSQRIRTILASLILHIWKRFAAGLDSILQGLLDNAIYPKVPAKLLNKVKVKMNRKLGSVRRSYRLDTTDIRELFDAAAKDLQHNRKARDQFIAPSDHAFYMAITRESGFWQSIAPVSHK
jgi:hypothetical protein